MSETFNLINARQCLQAFAGKPQRILVVGCGSRGEDVKAFNHLLGSDVEIHGVDIVDDIGAHYQASNVTYIQTDVTKFPVRSRSYDLAYSFATFEHIGGLQAAWQSMLDVLKPGGLLYTVAAPLWMSPYGHHKKNIFDGHRWVHLRYPTPEALLEWSREQGIVSPDATALHHHIKYMLDARFFNKHSSMAYLEAVSGLNGCAVVKNDFDILPNSDLAGNEDLLERFDKRDLLATVHRLIATATREARPAADKQNSPPPAKQYRPKYVWPSKAFPFRTYFDSQKLRIFIIENLQHNFEWISDYAHKFRQSDRFLVVIGGHHHDWLVKDAAEMFDALSLRRDQFVILYNDAREERLFSTHGFSGVIVNHNAWLDERAVMRPLAVEKKYNAVYVGRMIPMKRHELATQVPGLALIAGLSHGVKGDVVVPDHVFRNTAPLPPDEVCLKINESHCGLMLSKAEGACFASSEYLLCGVPVVSTRSEGGRDVWYNDYNSLIVEDHPAAVQEAVRHFVENPRDPSRIRGDHIAQAAVYRKRFIRLLQDIADEAGERTDMASFFSANFYHKMRKSHSPKFDEIFN